MDPTYDAAGNMAKRAAPDDLGTDASAQLITYDAWNRVVKITDNAGSLGTIAEYEYDALGRRIEKRVTGGDTYDYYHNESGQVVEVRKNNDANPYEQFAYDTDYIDAVAIRWYDADTDGDTNENNDGEQYYLYDASYCVIALLEADGDVLERYRYTPYGQRIVLDADFTEDTDNASDYGQQRGFQGLRHDEESGLIENRARMLDPLTGRFTQRDPLGYPDGMNSYAAYHVMYGEVDPTGKASRVVPTPAAQIKKCEARCAAKGEVLSHTVTTRYDYNLGICKFGSQTTKCICRPPANNPGKCTAQEHAYLERTKELACRGAGKYRAGMQCWEIELQMAKNKACIAGRNALKKCYPKLNAAHRREINKHEGYLKELKQQRVLKGCNTVA